MYFYYIICNINACQKCYDIEIKIHKIINKLTEEFSNFNKSWKYLKISLEKEYDIDNIMIDMIEKHT